MVECGKSDCGDFRQTGKRIESHTVAPAVVGEVVVIAQTADHGGVVGTIRRTCQLKIDIFRTISRQPFPQRSIARHTPGGDQSFCPEILYCFYCFTGKHIDHSFLKRCRQIAQKLRFNGVIFCNGKFLQSVKQSGLMPLKLKL